MGDAAKKIAHDLAVVAVADMLRREKKTARTLLAVERRAREGLAGLVKRSSASVMQQGVNKTATMSAIRREMRSLEAGLYGHLRSSLNEARAAAGHHAAIDSAVTDDAVSMASASSISSSWAATSIASVTSRGPKGMALVDRGMQGRVTRTAATEVARAFNDARELSIQLGPYRSAPLRGSTEKPEAKAFRVWSGFLDGRTCPDCWGLDGTVLELGKSFPMGPPPLHPHCRCTIEYLIIPKPERLEDIGIDYELFKQEIKDVVREGRAESMKHAQAFISESMSEKRSPLVLTDRFRRKPHEK